MHRWLCALLATLLVPAAAGACPWDDETWAAEGDSLPCVLDVISGAYPQHTRQYFEARIAAADEALRWSPGWLEALDGKAVALIRLRRLEEARRVLEERARIDPDGYVTHANLGTLYTFTGELDRALEHVDRAMAIDPNAHFGRERYHRMLVVFLRDLGRDPAVATQRDFLGLELTEEQRFHGSEQTFAAAGQDAAVFDALIAMIAVYGAGDVSHVHFALGDALALRGLRRMAWAAYDNARRLGHPRAREIRGWQERLSTEIRAEAPHAGVVFGTDLYRGVDHLFQQERMDARRMSSYATWERGEIRRGLAVWSPAGVDAIYQEQRRRRARCVAPIVIRNEIAPVLAEPVGAAR